MSPIACQSVQNFCRPCSLFALSVVHCGHINGKLGLGSLDCVLVFIGTTLSSYIGTCVWSDHSCASVHALLGMNTF